ncbi:MAG: hypothetical protein DI637_02230 [Citromicrobium sp.]|nr:MAG: hypothetical protein DI637_02230 [Citromicrobium sp.]
MRYISRLNPAGGIADFWDYIRQPTPHRWPILAASILATGGLMYWVTLEDYFVPPAPPSVSYITTLEDGRSDEEIRLSNIENQRLKEIREAEEERIAARKRALYRTLGTATGIDVSQAEAEGRAEREAAERARQERLDRLFDENGRTRADQPRDADTD